MHGTKPNSNMPSHISLFIPYLFSQFIFRSHSSYRLHRRHCHRQFLFSLSLSRARPLIRFPRSDCVCMCRWLCLWFIFGIFVFVRKIASMLSVFVVAERCQQQQQQRILSSYVYSMYFILKYYKSKRMTQSFRSDKLPANETSTKKNVTK